MRQTLTIIFCLLIFPFVHGQFLENEWYSQFTCNGLTIQNSYPKGGPYLGPIKGNYNHSYLVFFTRAINETDQSVEMDLFFSEDSIAIQNSPDTYMKLLLPKDTMTLAKRGLFSYGTSELETIENSTNLYKKISPKDDFLFYVVAIFYQTKPNKWSQERGGNRAEIFLEGQDLYYNLLPQVNSQKCGKMTFNN